MIKIKVPVKDLEKEDVCSKVEGILKKDQENAYTVGGLMVEAFGVKKEEIKSKAFGSWKKGLPTLYSRITRCLKKLESTGKVKFRKHGRAWVYWYVG